MVYVAIFNMERNLTPPASALILGSGAEFLKTRNLEVLEPKISVFHFFKTPFLRGFHQKRPKNMFFVKNVGKSETFQTLCLLSTVFFKNVFLKNTVLEALRARNS